MAGIIKTPRWYIDHNLWMKYSGIAKHYDPIVALYTNLTSTSTANPDINDLFTLNPTGDVLSWEGYSDAVSWLKFPKVSPVNYVAVFGHKGAAGVKIRFMHSQEGTLKDCEITGGVNMEGQLDGFSIWRFEDDENYDMLEITVERASFEATCISYGYYYDMVNAPNLSMTYNYEYPKSSMVKTQNGSEFSNTMTRPTKWNDLGAWELSSSGDQVLMNGSRLQGTPRKSYNVSFSMVDDGDLWGSNQRLTTNANNVSNLNNLSLYDDGDIIQPNSAGSDGAFVYNLYTDESFLTKVWNPCMGGLPFIFQSSINNDNPEAFCIGRFKDENMSASQTHPNIYTVSFAIEEVF